MTYVSNSGQRNLQKHWSEEDVLLGSENSNSTKMVKMIMI